MAICINHLGEKHSGNIALLIPLFFELFTCLQNAVCSSPGLQLPGTSLHFVLFAQQQALWKKKKAVKPPKPLNPLSNIHCQGDLGCNPYKPLNPAPHLSYQGNFGRLQMKRQGHISSSCSCQSTEQLQKSELRFRRKVSLSGLCIFPGSQIVT